jgi:hypothetical protein
MEKFRFALAVAMSRPGHQSGAVRALFRAPSSRQAAELPLATVAIEARQSAVHKLDHPQR